MKNYTKLALFLSCFLGCVASRSSYGGFGDTITRRIALQAKAKADAQATLGQLIQIYSQSGKQAAINAMNQVISMQNVDGTDGTHMMALIIVAASQNANPQVLPVILQLLMSEAVQDGNAKGVLKALQGYNPTVYQQAVTYIEAQVGALPQEQQSSYSSYQPYGSNAYNR